jgi:hypothetical protein
MNRRQKPPQLRTQAPAYRPAFERLDKALGENTPCNIAEKINLARIALFGDAARDLIRSEESGRQSSRNEEVHLGKSG